jgi:hypothetical protein
MSYFMTVSGITPDLFGLEPIEFVEVAKAQYYIERLAEQLIELDVRPLFLAHDGHSGTSRNCLPRRKFGKDGRVN